MATSALIPVEEYLSHTYHPDREYLDGELVGRNMGESDHSSLQVILASLLRARRRESGIHVFTELRVQISPSRFRIPDLLVTTSKVRERILHEPPFLCIEILSPEDRASRIQVKIDEYLEFGVPYVWVIDPKSRKAWAYTRDTRYDSPETLETKDPLLQISVKELFSELDEDIEVDD